jgi:hypothetical protein
MVHRKSNRPSTQLIVNSATAMLTPGQVTGYHKSECRLLRVDAPRIGLWSAEDRILAIRSMPSKARTASVD